MRFSWATFALSGLVACSVQPGGAGTDCVRSTECELGLVCIEGMCTDDLDALDHPGDVPVLPDEVGMQPDAMADASLDDAAVEPTLDAALPDAPAPLPDGGDAGL